MASFFDTLFARTPDQNERFKGGIGEGSANFVRKLLGFAPAQESVERRAQFQDRRDLRSALRTGDVDKIAAIDPATAGQALGVDTGQFELSDAQDEAYRDAALRFARAGEQAIQGGADPIEAFDFLSSRAGNLFGSPEELAATRGLVEQYGPEAFSIIRSGLTEQSKTDRTPAAIREFQFLENLPSEDQRRFLELKRTPQTFEIGGSRRLVVPGSAGAQTETLVAPSETAEGERIVNEAKATGKTVGESVVKDLDTKFGEAQQADMTLRQVSRARELLDEGVIEGSLPQQRLALTRAIQTATGTDIPESSTTAEYQAIVSEFVAQNIKAFGAGTGLSDADREFARAMSGGDLAGGVKALQRILDITENKAKDKIQRYNERRNSVVSRSADFGDLYPEFEASVSEQPQRIDPSSVPAAAVDLLRQDPSPERRRQFDEVFGAGASQSILGGR